MRVEHEYRRCGAWVYLAALDVHRARVFGRCEAKNGIVPFDSLVDQVTTCPPYSVVLSSGLPNKLRILVARVFEPRQNPGLN